MSEKFIDLFKVISVGLIIAYTIINYLNINALEERVDRLQQEKISGWGND
jgi:hypothetical protein